MRNSDKKVFKQAFDELSEEGYFDDFIARVKRSRSKKQQVKPKSGSANSAVQRVYYDKRVSVKK